MFFVQTTIYAQLPTGNQPDVLGQSFSHGQADPDDNKLASGAAWVMQPQAEKNIISRNRVGTRVERGQEGTLLVGWGGRTMKPKWLGRSHVGPFVGPFGSGHAYPFWRTTSRALTHHSVRFAAPLRAGPLPFLLDQVCSAMTCRTAPISPRASERGTYLLSSYLPRSEGR